MSSTRTWYPLTHGQEALWFLWKLSPESSAYNIVLPIGVRGALDTGVLQRCLQQLSDRHPCLRMELCERQGKPLQRALEDREVVLEAIDAEGWDDARLDDALRARARQGFALEDDATLRLALYRRGPEHHVLLLVLHHIVSDLWSFIVLMDELRELYPAVKSGTPVELPALPVSFEAFAGEQRQTMEGPEGERQWDFWRRELDGELPVLDLPVDRPRPAERSFNGGSTTHRMDANLTRRLQSLAGSERCTLFMALLAAYEVLLCRTSGRDTLLVGSPTSGRSRKELHGIVGSFVNMVAVRADLSGAPSFRQVLQQVRGKLVATMGYQDYPFSMLVERLQPVRDLSRPPLFQTSFVLQKFHRFEELSRVMLPGDDEPPIPFGDLELEPVSLSQQDGQYDLNLEMKVDEGGHLVGAWKYAADLFEAETVARMARHFETLLGEILAHPDRPVTELGLLGAEESRQILIAGRGKAVALPREITVCELFERRARQQGDTLAVRWGDASQPGTSLTYAELAQRVEAFARGLVELGVRADQLVALLLPRGLDFVTSLLALAKAGGAFLPLDPRQPADRLRRILERAGVPLVLAHGSTAALADEAVAGLSADHRPVVQQVETLATRGAASSVALPRIEGNQLAYVMFTSGSTGKPKGVMVEHRGMVNHVLAKLSDLEMGADAVLAQNGPQSFDIVVWQCLAPLVLGGRVEVFDDTVAEDPGALLEQLEARGVTVLQVVPSMLRALLEEVAAQGENAPPLRSLRWMVPTGEALPTELCRRWLAVYPQVPILNTYGSTECSDDQCHYVLSVLDGADEAVTIVSIGTPIHNMTAQVLDDNLAPVPAGVVGELYIGGLGVGRGYLDDPVRTAMAFVPDPAGEPGSRLYRSRDLSRRRSDGNLDFLSRVDHMIKLRGFRIEPGEIETALCRHPAISAAVARAQEHPSGERRLVAYLVPAEKGLDDPADGLPEDEALRRFLAQSLPHTMVPSLFCPLAALPLSANGKIDLARLPKPEWQGDAEADFIAPSTPTETTLARVWAEVLGLERVGATVDFFALGGDSIRSIQVVARCKDAGLRFRPGDLFLHQTVASLAAFIDRQAEAEPSVVDSPSSDLGLQVSAEHLELALAQVEFDDEPHATPGEVP